MRKLTFKELNVNVLNSIVFGGKPVNAVNDILCNYYVIGLQCYRIYLCRGCVVVQSGLHTECELEPEEGDELRLMLM